MENEDILETLRNFIIKNFFFGVKSIEFSLSDSLMQKGIVDSTGILELVNFIEQEFHISVEDDELRPENLDSLENLSAFISRKK